MRPHLPALRGHAEARERLARAAVDGTLPQSILLHGPAGIGKERFGLWIAQLLLCQSPLEPPAPCGLCNSCRLAERLDHPDVHWFFPLPRPENASADRLREKLEDLRAAELQLRRENPHRIPAFDRAPAHFLAAVQSLLQLAAVRPAMGARKVFVVGDAERMVPQESSPEAANAFLKLLEEPPRDTVLLLTSSQPGALLPTILSRVLPVRLAPVAEEEIRTYLVEDLGRDPDEAGRIAGAARGSIGRALRLVPGDEGEGPLEKARRRARELLLATLSTSAVPRLTAAHGQQPTGGRGDFSAELDALAEWLRDLLAVASGADAEVPDPEARQLLRRAVDQRSIHPLGAAAALERVGQAREWAQGNVNPQLILASLLADVQSDLRGSPV